MTATILALGLGGAGALTGHFLRLPFGALLGALVSVGAFELGTGMELGLHPSWQLVAQVLIGATIGAQLRPEALRAFRRIIGPGLAAVLLTVLAGVGLGWLLVVLTDVDPRTALFGLMPGGVGEMTAAAAALGGEASLVALMHLARLLVVIAVLPVLLRYLTDKPGRRHSKNDDS